MALISERKSAKPDERFAIAAGVVDIYSATMCSRMGQLCDRVRNNEERGDRSDSRRIILFTGASSEVGRPPALMLQAIRCSMTVCGRREQLSTPISYDSRLHSSLIMTRSTNDT